MRIFKGDQTLQISGMCQYREDGDLSGVPCGSAGAEQFNPSLGQAHVARDSGDRNGTHLIINYYYHSYLTVPIDTEGSAGKRAILCDGKSPFAA
jgi:hypothetical protein